MKLKLASDLQLPIHKLREKLRGKKFSCGAAAHLFSLPCTDVKTL